MKRIYTITLAVVLIVIIVAAAAFYYVSTRPSTVQTTEFKIAMVDNTYSYVTWARSLSAGLNNAVNQLNRSDRILRLQELYQIPQTELQSVVEQLIAAGTNLIIVPEVAEESTAVSIAAQHPNVYFLGMGGWSQSSLKNNTAIASFDVLEGYYLAGILAGGLTKTNTIGWMSAFDYPDNARNYNLLIAGANRSNPNVEGIYAYTGSWDDPVKGGQSAGSLIDAGADIVVSIGDGMTDGAIKECERRGKYSVGCYVDEVTLAPGAVFTSVLYDQTLYFKTALQSIENGTFGNSFWKFGLKEGVVDVAPYYTFGNIIPQSAQDLVVQVRNAVKDGTFVIPTVADTMPPK